MNQNIYDIDHKDKKNIENFNNPPQSSSGSSGSVYGIFHTILFFFALYLSFRCNNNKFNLGGFVFAYCCPHVYIIYQLSLNGACGIFSSGKIAEE
jgi:hypothetical protein